MSYIAETILNNELIIQIQLYMYAYVSQMSMHVLPIYIYKTKQCGLKEKQS